MPLQLLPVPKSIKASGASFALPKRGWIVLDLSPLCAGASAFNIAEQLATQLESITAIQWNIVRDSPLHPSVEIQFRHDPSIPHEQGYSISITPRGVTLGTKSAPGLFYAVQTLIQIARQSKKTWPAMEIDDSPDFDRRGVYHDCSRGKVPELGTLLQLIDDLATLKINEFQLYIENTYDFRRHPAIHSGTTPLTAEELMMLDAYCKARFIDFVPSLTSLGHFEKILGHRQYRHLGEIEPAEFRKLAPQRNVFWNAPFTLNVSDPASKTLLKEMFDEFLPNFSSPFFNICCDETWDLGAGKSKPLADKVGTGQLYVDWINFCNSVARSHNRAIMLWGDIIRDHPEKLDQLPRDATLLEWGYEAGHDFEQRLAPFAAAGLRFYVCPGTSSWQTFTGRTRNAFANGRAAAQAGMRHGAAGFLMTDWGDFGHQQMLAVSLLPMAFGAAISWNAQTTDAAVLDGASLHLFGDSTGTFARLLFDLGLTYEIIGAQRSNASYDFWLFREHWQKTDILDKVAIPDLSKLRAATEKLLGRLSRAKIQHSDSELIVAELNHSLVAIRHTVDRSLARKAMQAGKKLPAKDFRGLIKEAELLRTQFTQLWHARNKPSRLGDILAEWTRVISEYTELSRKKRPEFKL